MTPNSNAGKILVGIKVLHTVVWVFFVGCIVAIPMAGMFAGRRC
ncbi:MAG: hypothetical protein NTV52_06225 [Acidobacteria bacterium]|nr:hypothetical protein [Acidobacteriota bacterium]